jgi:hypothetical protein
MRPGLKLQKNMYRTTLEKQQEDEKNSKIALPPYTHTLFKNISQVLNNFLAANALIVISFPLQKKIEVLRHPR